MPYQRIHEGAFEEFFKSEDWRRNWISTNRPPEEVVAHDKRMSDRQEKRDRLKEEFPYTAILEGCYPEHDFVYRWCWQNIGPHHGLCQEGESSQYVGCPIVLATKHTVTGWYPDKNGNRVDWEEEAYQDVEEHSHVGNWCYLWLGKTGYDYGYAEYYFKSESDRDRFLAAIPVFQKLGE